MLKKFQLLQIPMATMFFFFSGIVAAQDEPSAIKTQTETLNSDSGSPQGTASPNNASSFHFDISPYLWLPGAHGVVGVLGRDAGFSASPGDLLSHLDFGLMGTADASYKRFVLNGDMIWIRLSDSHALPFPGLSAISADARAGQFVWTSKVGYRLIDHEKIKADANVGVRYWHLGEKLSFNPSILGLSFNTSQQWADIIVGGRIQIPLGEKVVFNVLGDVGGWNATANSDYQIAGVLGYRLSSRWTIEGGWRYLYVDYRPTSGSIYNMTTAGVLFGATYRIK
jgi:hypothetical protein